MHLLNAPCILFQEKDARDVEIPNIRWEVFELMMRFVELANLYIMQNLMFCVTSHDRLL